MRKNKMILAFIATMALSTTCFASEAIQADNCKDCEIEMKMEDCKKDCSIEMEMENCKDCEIEMNAENCKEDCTIEMNAKDCKNDCKIKTEK